MLYDIAVIVVTFFACVAIGTIISKLFRTDTSASSCYETCTSPNCVRCTRYNDVLLESHERFLHYLKDMKISETSAGKHGLGRIQLSFDMIMGQSENQRRAIHLKSSHQLSLLYQKPTVFPLLELRSRPYWETYWADIQKLEENFEIILQEFENAFSLHDVDGHWTVNSTPTGKWSIFSFVNQGNMVVENVKLCPRTWEIVELLECSMVNCVFGNILFSAVFPGTTITEHYGPTNIRIRCHLGLQIPDGCSITVNGLTKTWKEQKCMLFDDSFQHSVQYKSVRKKKQGGTPISLNSELSDMDTDSGRNVQGLTSDATRVRAVLIVDFWHPGLKEMERNSLAYAFASGDALHV